MMRTTVLVILVQEYCTILSISNGLQLLLLLKYSTVSNSVVLCRFSANFGTELPHHGVLCRTMVHSVNTYIPYDPKFTPYFYYGAKTVRRFQKDVVTSTFPREAP